MGSCIERETQHENTFLKQIALTSIQAGESDIFQVKLEAKDDERGGEGGTTREAETIKAGKNNNSNDSANNQNEKVVEFGYVGKAHSFKPKMLTGLGPGANSYEQEKG